MPGNIELRPIGYVRNQATEATDTGWGDVVSRIMLAEKYAPGLEGLENFTHLVVVTFLHEADFDITRDLRRRPRGLEAMPEIGIFSQRARHRPNPLGVSTVRIVRVGKESVEVRGLDAIDGTPVLDIKPYYPQFDAAEAAGVPAWVDELMADYY